MSQYHERKEKVCLNCSTALHGRYCHKCGQENIEPRETFWGLVTHFFYDITHFDGKFFNTTRYLITRPGFLSREYISGRRAGYLHPIRMYVFSSALFFIVFFSMFDVSKLADGAMRNTIDSAALVSEVRGELIKEAGKETDSVELEKTLAKIRSMPSDLRAGTNRSPGDSLRFNPVNSEYTSKASYDSAQRALPAAQRDSWLRTRLVHKLFDINKNFAESPRNFLLTWLNLFIHSFPQLLFISLPLFALLLQLLYIRHKQYYYADHAIFSIHLYVFTFVGLLLSVLLSKLADALTWRIFNFLNMVLAIYLVVYSYKAMRNFYRQGRLKTFVKYFLLTVSSSIVILILFVAFLLLSILKLKPA